MGGRGGAPPRNVLAGLVQAPSRPATPAPAAPVASLSVEDRIVSEFPNVTKHWHDGQWATLEGLRERLSDVDRADLDAALKRLDRARVIELMRDPDQKNISAGENRAGLMFGGRNATMYRVM